MGKNLSLSIFAVVIITISSCKDPREKTVWDYIESETANEYEFSLGVEALHRDLIKHGYMEEHSCDLLGCASAHQSTYADIERVRGIMNEPAVEESVALADDYEELYSEDTATIENETVNGLDNQYSNSYFNLRYPSSWQIVQDGNQVTSNTAISVQIMEKQRNDVDFRPNINIIVSNRKWEESTSYLAQQTSQNNKRLIPNYIFIGIGSTQVGGCNGSLLESTIEKQGYKLHSSQYIVKKSDNTTFIITATTDNDKHLEQMKIINQILKSIHIK